MVALSLGPVSKSQRRGQGSAQWGCRVAHPTRGLRGMEDGGSSREAYVPETLFLCRRWAYGVEQNESCTAGFGLDDGVDLFYLQGYRQAGTTSPSSYGLEPISIRQSPPPHSSHHTTMGRGNPVRVTWSMPKRACSHSGEYAKGTLWWWMRSMKYPDNTRDTFTRTESSCGSWSKLVPFLHPPYLS